MDGDWTMLAVLAAVSVGLIVGAALPVTDRQATKWSIRFRVLVDERTRDDVARRLRRARLIRTVSFVIGLNVGALSIYMNVIDPERSSSFANDLNGQAPFLAAAIGALLAEILVARRPSPIRMASLTRRRWSDYIEPFWVIVVIACVPISIAAAAIAGVRRSPNLDWLWIGPASAVAALVTMTIGVAIVTARPANLVEDETQRRVDDAFRADGAHHVVGASVALGGLGTCNTLIAAGHSILITLLIAPLTWVFIGSWYGIARTTVWNVDQARLQHA